MSEESSKKEIFKEVRASFSEIERVLSKLKSTSSPVRVEAVFEEEGIDYANAVAYFHFGAKSELSKKLLSEFIPYYAIKKGLPSLRQ